MSCKEGGREQLRYMSPHSGYPSISWAVCWSFWSGMWLIGVVCAQMPPVTWDWSERTVCITGWEQRCMSKWVGCECSSSEIHSRNNVENLGHFYRYIFPPKLSFQPFYSWFFLGGFLCISHSVFVGERFFPASLMLFAPSQRWTYTRSVCEVQYTRSRALWARQLHWAFADESLLLMVSYQLMSASAVLQVPFSRSTDFSLELNETVIPRQRCAAFLRSMWLPLDRFKLAGAQEVWVLGKPWELVSQ